MGPIDGTVYSRAGSFCRRGGAGTDPGSTDLEVTSTLAVTRGWREKWGDARIVEESDVW